VFATIPCSGLPRKHNQNDELNDVEFVPKEGKPYSGRNPANGRRRFTSTPEPSGNNNDSNPEDFTMTGNPALDTSIIGTIGTIASTIIKSIFSRGDDRSRDGSKGGFLGFFSTLFCKIFGGLFKPSSAGETCSSGGSGGSDVDTGAFPTNMTSEQLKMVEDYMYAY